MRARPTKNKFLVPDRLRAGGAVSRRLGARRRGELHHFRTGGDTAVGKLDVHRLPTVTAAAVRSGRPARSRTSAKPRAKTPR